MLDGTQKTMDTNSGNQQQSPKSVEANKFVVARLDIHTAPGWFDVRTYDNFQDADIYCTMLNQDTGMIHRVFIADEE